MHRRQSPLELIWSTLAQDGDRWRVVMNAVVNLVVLEAFSYTYVTRYNSENSVIAQQTLVCMCSLFARYVCVNVERRI
jgi:hypothetical protein